MNAVGLPHHLEFFLEVVPEVLGYIIPQNFNGDISFLILEGADEHRGRSSLTQIFYQRDIFWGEELVGMVGKISSKRDNAGGF